MLHYKVLSRLLDAEGNTIAAGRFLPWLERFGWSARLDRLMVTTAREDLAAPSEDDGRTFVIDAPGAVGRPEPRVVL